jgi:hypothetical protein
MHVIHAFGRQLPVRRFIDFLGGRTGSPGGFKPS